ncbi:MAG: Asp23/Gls24 family envelope stress response protein [Tissierellia bacterium]|nr:Asp23/Gls24 family envelope stress response protein [Tissierellia bacterium]
MTDFKNGSVKISNIIIDQLIAESALKVEGVKAVVGYHDKRVDTKKKDSVISEINGTDMKISLSLILDTNKKINEVAENVQKTIKEQVKVMLNLDVSEVKIYVKNIELAK